MFIEQHMAIYATHGHLQSLTPATDYEHYKYLKLFKTGWSQTHNKPTDFHEYPLTLLLIHKLRMTELHLILSKIVATSASSFLRKAVWLDEMTILISHGTQ